MRLFFLSVLIVLLSQATLWANTDTFCIESWKKGKTQITEKNLTLTLDAKTSNYTELIYDSTGKKKYKLNVSTGEGSKGIIEFVASLEQVSSKGGNLLKPTNDRHQDFYSWQDYFGQFYKGSAAQFKEYSQFNETNVFLPFLSKRVVKVENFYCVFQITDYKQNKDEDVVLDSVTLQVQFANEYDLSNCISNEKK